MNRTEKIREILKNSGVVIAKFTPIPQPPSIPTITTSAMLNDPEAYDRSLDKAVTEIEKLIEEEKRDTANGIVLKDE